MSKQVETLEYNFDGLVGPTHNYSGLSFGNIASKNNAGSISHPKLAAKQGLQKMRTLMNLGIPQAVLPPQQRPNFELLRSLGFSGDNAKLLQQAYKYQPQLLAACYSAASMWVANMATVSPSADTNDNRVHFTPANLSSNLHRAQEAEFSHKILSKIFANQEFFQVHQPLAAFYDLSDEGAANHSRLCRNYGDPGLEIFAYGRTGLGVDAQVTKYPGRQTKLACNTVMLQHSLTPSRTIILQQNPVAIDAGVFHNDVICVANKNTVFLHKDAFVEFASLEKIIKQHFADDCHIIAIDAKQLSLASAVESYIFNSQLVSLPSSQNDMGLIVPMECKYSPQASSVLQEVLSGNNPIKKVEYLELRESMRNGGGPACLRLRVVLTAKEAAACHAGIILNEQLCTKLEAWVEKHYRDKLAAEDLLDPLLAQEVFIALDELTQLLNLGSIYQFQQL